MTEHLSPISVAQRLHQTDLFFFTPLLLADLFGLKRRRAYRLIARLKVNYAMFVQALKHMSGLSER